MIEMNYPKAINQTRIYNDNQGVSFVPGPNHPYNIQPGYALPEGFRAVQETRIYNEDGSSFVPGPCHPYWKDGNLT